MGKYIGLGRHGQVKHPYIRGRLSPQHQNAEGGKIVSLEEYLQQTDETYFVPSFSIRRHLHRSEEAEWGRTQHEVKRALGRGFSMVSAEDVSIKAIEQHRLIVNMRRADIHPDPEEIKDIAYSVRDELTELLSRARSPLEIPLGSLSRFGYQNNALSHHIDGWRGDRTQYGPSDYEGYMDTHAVMLAERRIAVGALALAYGDEGLDTDGIASATPHVTIARAKEAIGDEQMHGIRQRLSGIVMRSASFGDPVISMKLYQDEPAENIYVKHAWESLAITA